MQELGARPRVRRPVRPPGRPGRSLRPARALLPLCLLSCLLPLSPLYGGETRSVQGRGVILRFEKPLQAAAEEVLSLYPATRARLERIFGWKLDFRPTVILIRKRETFLAMAGHEMFVAFAVPRDQSIVIDYSQMGIRPFTLETTLRHELCHLLLHRYIEESRLPRWLDEGVAQWASDGIAEILVPRGRSALQRALLRGTPIPIEVLAVAFPRAKDPLALAYEESKSLVEYIVARFGREGLLGILENLRRGATPGAALAQATSLSLDELERAWHDVLRKRMTWLTYLLANVYEIVFFLAALTVIFAFLRVMARKRAYMRQEEEELYLK